MWHGDCTSLLLNKTSIGRPKKFVCITTSKIFNTNSIKNLDVKREEGLHQQMWAGMAFEWNLWANINKASNQNAKYPLKLRHFPCVGIVKSQLYVFHPIDLRFLKRLNFWYLIIVFKSNLGPGCHRQLCSCASRTEGNRLMNIKVSVYHRGPNTKFFHSWCWETVMLHVASGTLTEWYH